MHNHWFWRIKYMHSKMAVTFESSASFMYFRNVWETFESRASCIAFLGTFVESWYSVPCVYFSFHEDIQLNKLVGRLCLIELFISQWTFSKQHVWTASFVYITELGLEMPCVAYIPSLMLAHCILRQQTDTRLQTLEWFIIVVSCGLCCCCEMRSCISHLKERMMVLIFLSP